MDYSKVVINLWSKKLNIIFVIYKHATSRYHHISDAFVAEHQRAASTRYPRKKFWSCREATLENYQTSKTSTLVAKT